MKNFEKFLENRVIKHVNNFQNNQIKHVDITKIDRKTSHNPCIRLYLSIFAKNMRSETECDMNLGNLNHGRNEILKIRQNQHGCLNR